MSEETLQPHNKNFTRVRLIRRSLSGRILRSTTLNILILVIICCGIMAFSMQSLANSILLDSLQPMARQSAKTVEANIHMLADRMMTIAGDSRMTADDSDGGDGKAAPEAGRQEVLTEAAEIYELHTIALYDTEGLLIQGISDAPERPEEDFFSLLRETDNLTISSSTLFQDDLGITMGMPVKKNGETFMYVIGVYKYDTLDDVISSINIGRHGTACMVNRQGVVTGHPDRTLIRGGSTLAALSDGNNETLSRVTTGETGATEFSADGETMMAAFSPIRGTHWSLIIQVPKADYASVINRAMTVAVLATAAVLIISILLVLRLSRSISRPVKNVTGRMVALSDGDLHTEVIPVRSGDELEVLTRTLDATVESVNRYISDIRQVLTRVAEGNLNTEPQVDYQGDFSLIRSSLSTIIRFMNETIAGFRSAAVRLANMADELNRQSGGLHQASMEQTRSAESLVHEVANVKERLSGVTENSALTRTGSEEIAGCVRDANTRMASLSGAMDNISANAQEITKIAKAIEDIAFQTNILSLNASIEAARAGSAGKGFAVVAGEVRELAARSAEAARHATAVVTETGAFIRTGVELTADTADSLQAISSVSDRINEISDQLMEAVREQETALTDMEEKIDTISSIAGQNLQNAGNTAQSSSLLAKEAESLQSRVEKFVVKEETHR